MAKIALDPTTREQIAQSLKELEDLDEQFEILEELGDLPAGFKQAHDQLKRRAKLYLEHF